MGRAMSATPPAQSVTIDRTAPAAAVAITAIANDSGTATDFITNDTTLTVSGSNGALAAGKKVQVSTRRHQLGRRHADHGDGLELRRHRHTRSGHSFTYEVRGSIDGAGNVGTTDSQAVASDTIGTGGRRRAEP